MDCADSLMADRKTWLDRIFALDDMNVRSADCRQADLDDRFSSSGFRNRLFFEPELPGSTKDVCHHYFLPGDGRGSLLSFYN